MMIHVSRITNFVMLVAIIAGAGCFNNGGGGDDDTKPTITSVDPADGSSGISVNTMVRVQFSEAMDDSTINTDTFTLSDSTGSAVGGAVSYADRVAAFTPAAALQAGSAYTAKITAGAEDKAGNPLKAGRSWSFTTAAEGAVPAPSFDPMAGTYSAAQNVKIACSDGGASIRYTTDGSTPSGSYGTVYSGPIPVAVNTTFKAVAYRNGAGESTIVTAAYIIKTSAPAFNPAAGTHAADIEVALSTITPGAEIHYTTTACQWA